MSIAVPLVIGACASAPQPGSLMYMEYQQSKEIEKACNTYHFMQDPWIQSYYPGASGLVDSWEYCRELGRAYYLKKLRHHHQ